MTLGLITSFFITFTLLPTLLNFVPNENITVKEYKDSYITSFLRKVSIKNQKFIFSTSILIIILSIFGISKLEVENSFINYFSKKTEIYKGMKLIDEKLGGTTPLEIILKFPEKEKEDENDEFVRHDWKISWSSKSDAEKVLEEIVQQRFEEVSQ